MVMCDKDFVKQVEEMLIEDLSKSTLVRATEYTEASFLFRLAVNVSRLMAPVQ